MRISLCLILLAAVACKTKAPPSSADTPVTTTTGAGSWRLLGKPGEWRGTTTGTAIGDKLYTTEVNGALYVTDAQTGAWKQIGKPEFRGTVFLAHTDDTLYSVEATGSLYAINPSDGSWKPIGKPGAWKGTTAGTILGGKLYTTEVNGALYVTDLSTGEWKQIGKPEFIGTVVLFSSGPKLYSIETSGSLYEIDPDTGAWKGLGKPGDWRGTTAAAVLDGKLYTTELNGVLYETDLSNGAWKALGKPEFKDTVVIFPAKDSLLTIERGGSLYAVQVR
jgi:hypothetical protein